VRGRQLVTLEDAGAHIMKLPKAEQDLPEWQTAVAMAGDFGDTNPSRQVMKVLRFSATAYRCRAC